ncbi:phage baseplate assembly protein [Brevundimonas vitis]|uniref:Phage baseplate assembly protein n=1 Tax=Brevundimonas vitisensis TaxID=2800818 RepID=A0ABX7BVY4_9CAUL|nr:phage baseplate assembly protein [Brevundimonas vitisensis]QQQ19665.1 phage baseplate assembly protein [Brevundimonas vitisensis]
MKGMATLRARFARSVGRFLLTLVDDSGPVQRLQGEVLDGEVLDRVERVQDYGLSSRPAPGAEGILIAVAGSRGQGVVVGLGDRRVRIALIEGEVALHDDLGQVVHLTRDGIRVASPIRVEIEAPEIGLSATTEMTLASPKIVLAADEVLLGGEGGTKAIARHDDAVVAGKVVATSAKVKAQ